MTRPYIKNDNYLLEVYLHLAKNDLNKGYDFPFSLKWFNKQANYRKFDILRGFVNGNRGFDKD